MLESMLPARHKDQPAEKNVSKKVEETSSHVDFWREVAKVYSLCSGTITLSSDFAETPAAKEWTSIIRRRRQWMKEDENKLDDKIRSNKRLGGEQFFVLVRDSESNPSVSALADDTSLKRTCRMQEDRLRQLRTRAIEAVCDRPSKASREYRDGETYDEKVRQTLRDVYDQCAKARKAFIREFDAKLDDRMGVGKR